MFVKPSDEPGEAVVPHTPFPGLRRVILLIDLVSFSDRCPSFLSSSQTYRRCPVGLRTRHNCPRAVCVEGAEGEGSSWGGGTQWKDKPSESSNDPVLSPADEVGSA